MDQGKQATTLRRDKLNRRLNHISHSRPSERDGVIAFMSFEAEPRIQKTAGLIRSMTADASGKLAGRISSTTTQRYIRGDTAAKRRVISLI